MFYNKAKIILLLIFVASFLFLANHQVSAEKHLATDEEIKLECRVYQAPVSQEGDTRIYKGFQCWRLKTGLYCKDEFGQDQACAICTDDNRVIDECRVGWMNSNPYCACCGDCTLNDALGVGTGIARQILKYLGVLALGLFIIGGIMWMTSGGNTQRIERGKKIITGAIIGMIIVFAAYLIIQVIIQMIVPPEIQKEYFQGLF